MGYPELSRALREETERQLAELAAETDRAAAALVDGSRRELAAERAAALAADDHAAAEARRRAVARQALEEERELLGEARRLLGELAAETAARLPSILDAAVAARLAMELLGELEGDGWELHVDAAHVEAVRRVAAMPVVAAPLGGVAAVRGRRTLDNTLRSRLERAWPAAEPELARRLFGQEAP
jgi:vacuolar-type H+-ATPase subunit E/Vma4